MLRDSLVVVLLAFVTFGCATTRYVDVNLSSLHQQTLPGSIGGVLSVLDEDKRVYQFVEPKDDKKAKLVTVSYEGEVLDKRDIVLGDTMVREAAPGLVQDGNFYLYSFASNLLEEVDMASGETRQIPTPFTDGLVSAETTRNGFVAVKMEGEVAVIDAATGEVRYRQNADGYAFSADANELASYEHHDGKTTLRVADLKSGSETSFENEAAFWSICAGFAADSFFFIGEDPDSQVYLGEFTAATGNFRKICDFPNQSKMRPYLLAPLSPGRLLVVNRATSKKHKRCAYVMDTATGEAGEAFDVEYLKYTRNFYCIDGGKRVIYRAPYTNPANVAIGATIYAVGLVFMIAIFPLWPFIKL